jgi:pyruvate/2-oxoglutarate dehydrogenase complex dihydrolipoamide acyltransferase (E2) component
MKMHNNIFAPLDGIVKSINTKEGERVPKKFVIIELAEKDEAVLEEDSEPEVPEE